MNTEKAKKKTANLLYILLALVLYIALIPLTIIQAIVFGLQYMVTSENLFDKYRPLSAEVASIIIPHCR
jgi:uncharacterized membrane protein